MLVNKQKKIFIVSIHGTSNAGGVERVVFYLARVFANYGQVIIVNKEMIQSYWLTKYFSKILPARLFRAILPILNALYLMGNAKHEDLVVSNGYQLILYPIDYLFVHGNMLGLLRAVFPEQKICLSAIYEFMAGRFAKRIIAVSQNAKLQWQNYYHLENKVIDVVNNCVDSDVFIPQAREHQKIRVLFVGRLDKTKNPVKLLELAKMIEDYADMELHIITNNGDGVANFANLNNTKTQVGLDFSQISHEYNKCDVLFFPSLYEGFEMVTLEALSSGIPVIGNNVGAVRELFVAGVNGVYLMEEDFIEQIRSVAQQFFDYNHRISLHNSICEFFSIPVYMSKIATIINT
ncbi:MAG: glycosyltransferase family 4 protein [Burkholderiales bacterium]|nr:glycosyltransferase family 4 protein [Burkholderiales bacterium]